MTITYKSRVEVPEKEKWNFEDLYKNLEDWENDYLWIEKKTAELKKFDGAIHNGESLYDYLSEKEEVSSKLNLVYVYGMLQADVDTRDALAQSLVDRAKQLSVKISAASSFFMPFLLSLEESTLREYIEQEPRLKYFEQDLFEAFRYKAHVLTKEKEEILSNLGEALSAPSHTYSMLNNADIKFGEVTNDEGMKVELTRGMYSKLIEDEDRDKRREAYKAYYQPYLQLKNSIASTLSANVKTNTTLARLRNYPTALEKGLFGDMVPKEVYENLITATKANIGPLHQYGSIRKKLLGLEELRQYDLNVPLVPGVKLEISYEEAYETILKALAPLGEDYVNTLKTFKDARYIDVRETPGKRSGAYNLGVYGVHPFVLLNQHDDLDSMFTMIHEFGHAMHSWYSSKHQPRISAGYSIFVAEVASTVNEVLLIHYLLERETNQEIRKYLLNHFIDQFRGTFFTQVMFAEFEKITHEYAESGKPLNANVFSEIYESLFRQYNGDEVVFDEEVKYGWSRIPHFYRPFYVYKYATGFASAIHIAEQLLSRDESAVNAYIEFLKSGSSDYPLELLKKTGVDLSKPEPIDNALKRFEQLISEFAAL
ncbi:MULTISPECIES: oligoendopeptidase F [Neobacillus]|uniref:Oligopeptidase F n=1 Tax=Neobacillus rhizophilus TaxID=2833579 RepID=A0A942U2U3_9BACI|nr:MULTISPECIES: oligoendopeptidase F [Neobacillus]MBS4211262.1 oligoendopeptidase F [Neobacillus rhizophilus]MBU8918785.1 oligoendopeptidase F [Bacillus sp. FJAT-29953]